MQVVPNVQVVDVILGNFVRQPTDPTIATHHIKQGHDYVGANGFHPLFVNQLTEFVTLAFRHSIYIRNSFRNGMVNEERRVRFPGGFPVGWCTDGRCDATLTLQYNRQLNLVVTAYPGP